MSREVVVILDSIRSAYNVGAIFRTADGAGVEKILLVGYTPAPTDRFGRINPQIVKTSLGASTTVPYEHIYSLEECIEALERYRSAGYTLVAIEQTEKAVSLHNATIPSKVVYVFGNEIEGVSLELLAMVDQTLFIPMCGTKESLNVSVSVGIVLYQP